MNKTLAACAATLIAAGSAQAGLISFSDAIAETRTNWSYPQPASLDGLSLPRFDGSLGMLESVTFHYASNVRSSLRAKSLDAAPSTITATAQATIHFNGPIGDTLTAINGLTMDVGASDGVRLFNGNASLAPDPLELLAFASRSLTLTNGLGAFIGTGSYDIPVSALGSSSVSGPSNMLSSVRTYADASVQVDYTYRVPEPASLGLVGLALAGVALASRRR